MIGKLRIHLGLKSARTFLKSVFFTTPFKIANITENKKDRGLHLMLMSSSPGVLDGDDFEITIRLDAHSSLRLHTQSYQRLFEMKGGAQQKTEVHVGSGASFCFIPHPVVPHAGADFTTCNKIFLSAAASLVWGEVLTCGRKLNGETFRFKGYRSRTEIFRNGRLIVKENLVAEPASIDLQSIGQLEGYSHQASLIYVDEMVNSRQVIAAVHSFLEQQPEIVFGISALSVNGIVIRLLGNKGEQLYDCLLKLNRLFSNSKALQL